ncbi:hypothetical protein HPP92_008657 [Vanilla planifolia]|uniref:non-specific serine/threonine protein kinase n=1 Tax=Vanilla planifolia TaxID=51239 RepID=A0A835V5V9_VANPL|nr:hypothetical protein HPP92_008657 [Vanilla planifolia]
MPMGAKEEKDVVFWMTFLWFLGYAAGLLSPKGVNFEVQALTDIKPSLKDPRGSLQNWDKDSVDPCSWTMVTCSSQNLVIGLGAPSQSLSGSLSPSIGNLSNLEIVLLQNNEISGSITKEIGKLKKLRTLDLSCNHFSGEIPTSLGQLRNLQYLFPESLANITELSFLDLSFNNLTGPLPKFPARTFNIAGNPLICEAGSDKECYGSVSIPSFFIQSALPNASTSSKFKIHRAALASGISIGLISLFFLAMGLYHFWRHKYHQQIFFDVNAQRTDVCLGNLKVFQFRELQTATDNFSSKNIIGKGGFGNVYRGQLQDGTLVAVKRLKDGHSVGGEVQFQTELLVYPHMSNGSVSSRLKAKPALNWDTRKRIALGTARGLLYLHEQWDVKAANVLLDDDCEAVVGDFGLAKLLRHQDSHVTTAVRGTVGHIAPEYLSTGQSSEKTDVFGFGILLLELITGQRALEFGKGTNQKGAILDWVRKLNQEKKTELLIDKELKNKYDRIEMEEMVKVALLCTEFLPGNRPRMSDVVRMLEGEGLSERWEESKRSDNCGFRVQESCSSERFSDLTDDSSLLIQAMELSGPR